MTEKATLFYHAGAIGDFITVLPALRLWRINNPGQRAVFIGSRHTGRLAVKAGYADEAMDIGSATFLPLFSGSGQKDLRSRFENFSAALIFSDPAGPVASFFQQCKIEEIFCQPPFSAQREHVVDYHLSIFNGRFKIPEDRAPVIPLSGRTCKRLQEFDRVVLHHGSGSPLKNWPEEKFAGLSGHLRKEGLLVCWITGPAEGPPPAEPEDIVYRNEDLFECGTFIRDAGLFVGNDSGITHLAAAFGCWTIALFGASDPAVWRPLGKNVRVIESAVPCSPCHPKGASGPDCDRRCMEAIAVETVLEQIFSMTGKTV